MDRLLPRGGLGVVAYFAVSVALFEVAGTFHEPVQSALQGVGTLAAGGWCALNFWRCRHAHCLVTGTGWLALSALCFVGAVVGRSVVGGHEGAVFVAVLLAGCGFECAWRARSGTNAVLRSQSEDGRGLAPLTRRGLSSRVSVPSPPWVQRTSRPEASSS